MIDTEGAPKIVILKCFGMFLVGPKRKRIWALDSLTQLTSLFPLDFLFCVLNLNSFQLETVDFPLLTLVKSSLGKFLLFIYNEASSKRCWFRGSKISCWMK